LGKVKICELIILSFAKRPFIVLKSQEP